LKGSDHSFAFIADQTTFTNPERLVLVVDLYEEPGRTFRVIPHEMWSVQNNLSVANVDFYEFADNIDADGVFRGFS
jgi:maltoporin